MSDNIPPDLIERELEARFRIPNEVWTDVFKLLPRRILVQIVSPVCYRFKEICNKNVKNVHVIKEANQFANKLEDDDPEANQQLEHLAGNKCHLAGQFRMTLLSISDEKSQAILHHCPELFNGCKIDLRFLEENKRMTMFLECLGHLEAANPVAIWVLQLPEQVTDFWHHPTFQNCTRLDLCFPLCWPQSAASSLMAESVNIFDWLHHRRQPNGNGMDFDGSAAAADQQVVRCMIATFSLTRHEPIEWLLNNCSQHLQNSVGPADRRPFVFSFKCQGWPGFGQFHRAENKSTGEVLLLDRVMRATNGKPIYRLRRCLVEEEANGPEFYAGMFKPDLGYEAFNIDDATDKTPTVVIQ